MRIGNNPLVSSRNCSPKILAMNENRFLYGKHFYSFGIGTYLPETLGSVYVRVVVGGGGGTCPLQLPTYELYSEATFRIINNI